MPTIDKRYNGDVTKKIKACVGLCGGITVVTMPTDKKTKQQTQSDYAARERQSYYKDRAERLVTFQVEDVKFKERLREVADAEGRSINNWIEIYILPTLREIVEAQEKKKRR